MTSPSEHQPAAISERTTGTALFAGRRDVVAMRVGGELRDLFVEVGPDDVVEPVTIGSPDGLAIVRHSAAHVLAQAVQQVNPDAKLGIGPPITDGFYYDFDVSEPFTPEDLRALEKAMARSTGRRARVTLTSRDKTRSPCPTRARNPPMLHMTPARRTPPAKGLINVASPFHTVANTEDGHASGLGNGGSHV